MMKIKCYKHTHYIRAPGKLPESVTGEYGIAYEHITIAYNYIKCEHMILFNVGFSVPC